MSILVPLYRDADTRGNKGEIKIMDMEEKQGNRGGKDRDKVEDTDPLPLQPFLYLFKKPKAGSSVIGYTLKAQPNRNFKLL